MLKVVSNDISEYWLKSVFIFFYFIFLIIIKLNLLGGIKGWGSLGGFCGGIGGMK
jgi:hypothetical protein